MRGYQSNLGELYVRYCLIEYKDFFNIYEFVSSDSQAQPISVPRDHIQHPI